MDRSCNELGGLFLCAGGKLAGMDGDHRKVRPWYQQPRIIVPIFALIDIIFFVMYFRFWKR